MADMLINRFVIVVVGSTSLGNLSQIMKAKVGKRLHEMVSRDQLKLIYSSRAKADALEDTLVFSPQLFKLNKSVILAEPVAGIFNQEARVLYE